jgi:putative membrane protein
MLSTNEADRIERAIRGAETATNAEIVVCIRKSSGEDRGIAAMAGALVLLLVVGLFETIHPEIHLFISVAVAFVLALAAFLACDGLDLGLKLLPARLVARDARRAARETFLDRGLDATPQRNAVLLFISRAERYVEILPDRGLVATVPQQRWADIVASFKEGVRQKGMVDAAADAIAQIGTACAGPFPADANNPDLLANKPLTE